MKSFSKTIIYVLLLSVIPARIWAQDDMLNHAQEANSHEANVTRQVHFRDYENGFLFNVYEIENVEERVQLASALATSDIWLCNPTANPGELFIRPNSYHTDIPIYAEFDYLRMTLREAYEEASLLPKEEFAEIFNSWAHNISHEYYNFLISDHLDRANHCMDAEPFCTSNVYNFPALNSGYSWSGPNYGCLNSSPTNKHSFWYYMRIGVAGDITIKIEASFDVDFALWGPFSNQTDPCPTAAGQAGMLTADCNDCPNNTSNANFYPSGNLHDCSFDARHYEYAHVVNGEVGQYYILLITNYSGSDGYITFQKYAGDGETDCSIMPPLVNGGGPYCVGDTIRLTAQNQAGASFRWSGPNGFSSNEQNPIIPNCTIEMAGIYTCTISLSGETSSAETEYIQVNALPVASFDYTEVCVGEATQFNSTATTDPAGQDISSFDWNFDDGETGRGRSISHTYAEPGIYHVTHHVSTGGSVCNDEITETVVVHAYPVASTSASPASVMYGDHSTITVEVETPGNYSFHWEPANMVTNPDSQTTQTVAIEETTIFTCTITNLDGGCSITAQVAVAMAGSHLAATVSADHTSLCQGESTLLHALPIAGTGIYDYSWTPTNTLSNANTQNPTATPPVGTTTYTCTIDDGLTTYEVSIDISVHPTEEKDIYASICEDDSYDFFGDPLTTEGVYDHTLATNHYLCDSVVHLHLSINPVDWKSISTEHLTYSANVGCDSAYWNPGNGFVSDDQYQPENNWFKKSSKSDQPYKRTYTNQTGCDSVVSLNLSLEYTPNPIEIRPVDLNDQAPHWVVTATEFQINSYDFYIKEGEHSRTCHWDSIVWKFEDPTVEWILEPDETTEPTPRMTCKMFVLNYIPDTIWLDATVYNKCAPDGITRRYWFVSSFYGIDEDSATSTNFTVIPNPNNGQMQLHFEHLEGKAVVKVYDMRGMLIDNFETYNSSGRFTYPYDMKTYADGIYFFIVTTKEGTASKKIVIQR